jgi:hypothetical protein
VEIGSTAAIPSENPQISPPPKAPNTTISELKAFLSSEKKNEIWTPNAARSRLEPVFGSEIVTRVHAALNCNPSAPSRPVFVS